MKNRIQGAQPVQVCLVGHKGADPSGTCHSVASDVIYSERRGQSQKPEEIYQIIEALVPNGVKHTSIDSVPLGFIRAATLRQECSAPCTGLHRKLHTETIHVYVSAILHIAADHDGSFLNPICGLALCNDLHAPQKIGNAYTAQHPVACLIFAVERPTVSDFIGHQAQQESCATCAA